MAQTELIMKKLAFVASLMLCGFAAMGQEYEWEAAQMDGSRTGTISPSKDNVAEALGEFKGGKYVAYFQSFTNTYAPAEKLEKQLVEMSKYEEIVHHYADMRLALDLDDGVKVNYAKLAELLTKIK